MKYDTLKIFVVAFVASSQTSQDYPY